MTESQGKSVIPLAAQSIEYWRGRVVHPLLRAVRFISIFGIVLGALGVTSNVLILTRGIITRRPLPNEMWLGILITTVIVDAVLFACACASLRASPAGRRGMIVYAYL